MSYNKNKQKNGWPKRDIPHYSNSETSFNVCEAKNSEQYADELEQRLANRLKEYDASTAGISRKERFAVFSQCFEETIRQHGTFAPLLSDIKHEYENCIEAVFRGEKDAAFLYRNLATGISGPKTLANYAERIQDLEEKKRFLRKSNAHLRNHILRAEVKKVEKKAIICDVFRNRRKLKNDVDTSSSKMDAVGDRRAEFDALKNREFRMRVLEMYKPSQQTDLKFLDSELQRLQEEFQGLKKVFDKRYKLREMKDRLVEKLLEKEKIKGELQERWLDLRDQFEKLEERSREEKRRHGNKGARSKNTIKDLVKHILLMAIRTGGSSEEVMEAISKTGAVSKVEPAEDTSSTQDSAVEQEDHEEMIKYMETFEQLFKKGDFEEAAMVAATSPQDILRTAKTFQRFKEKRAKLGEKSPLVQFCEAISVTSGVSGQKGLSTSESIDAVEKALEEGLRDVVVEWVSQNKLKLSNPLGEAILAFCSCAPVPCACGYCVLAEVVFRGTKAHGKVVSCLCRQGRLTTAIYYGRNVGKFRKNEFMEALRAFPRLEFASLLLEASGGYLSAPLCLEECVCSLLRSGAHDDVIQFLARTNTKRLRLTKLLDVIKLEDLDLWKEFWVTLNNQLGLVDLVYDVMAIIVLAEVFFGVQFKMLL